MTSHGHTIGQIQSVYGQVTADQWRAAVKAADDNGKWHDGSPTHAGCPRCSFLTGFCTAIVAARTTLDAGAAR